MASIGAGLLLTGIIATFLSVKSLALLAAGPLARTWNDAKEHKNAPLALLQEALGNNKLYAKARRTFARRKHDDALQAAAPEAIRLLCISLESGSSLALALRYAANNCSEPLASELKRAVWDLEAGQSFNKALEGLRQRTGGTEFAYLAVAMEIQHQSGGSLAPILDNVASLLKQSSELKEELRTKTEQGRLSSRIVAVMPFLLLAVLSVFSPGYLSTFFSSPLGFCLLILALALELIGIVLVRRCLAIDFTLDFEEAV